MSLLRQASSAPWTGCRAPVVAPFGEQERQSMMILRDTRVTPGNPTKLREKLTHV